jgi:hypothetical protein
MNRRPISKLSGKNYKKRTKAKASIEAPARMFQPIGE